MFLSSFFGSVATGYAVAVVMAADVPSGIPEIGTGIGLIATLIFFLRLFVQDTLANQRSQTGTLVKIQENMSETNLALVKLSSIIAEHIREDANANRALLDKINCPKELGK